MLPGSRVVYGGVLIERHHIMFACNTSCFVSIVHAIQFPWSRTAYRETWRDDVRSVSVIIVCYRVAGTFEGFFPPVMTRSTKVTETTYTCSMLHAPVTVTEPQGKQPSLMSELCRISE